jgi:hypothetical protein
MSPDSHESFYRRLIEDAAENHERREQLLAKGDLDNPATMDALVFSVEVDGIITEFD